MASAELRLATMSDCDGIARLLNGAYRGENAVAGWTSEIGILEGPRTDTATVAKIVTSETTTFLLLQALADDELIGCVAVEPAGGSCWYLSMLSIAPDRQAKGFGRRLLTAAEEHVRDRGAASVRMTVIQVRTDLIAWYQRRGYSLTGATEPFPYGDDSVGVPRRDDLHFVVLEKKIAI